jgi:hypothetical protein
LPSHGGASYTYVGHYWTVEAGDSLQALTVKGRQEGKF